MCIGQTKCTQLFFSPVQCYTVHASYPVQDRNVCIEWCTMPGVGSRTRDVHFSDTFTESDVTIRIRCNNDVVTTKTYTCLQANAKYILSMSYPSSERQHTQRHRHQVVQMLLGSNNLRLSWPSGTAASALKVLCLLDFSDCKKITMCLRMLQCLAHTDTSVTQQSQ